MFKTKIKSLALALMLAVQVVVPTTFASALSARAYGVDTVAGYASLLRTSVLTSGKDVVFVVEKPDTSVVRIMATADLEGIARADLYGHQTKLAGTYKVAVYYPGSVDASPQSTFMVYPDRVSASQSLVSGTSQMLEADGKSHTFVTVTLYDAYRNAIKDHAIKLISSRTEDTITALNAGITDADGRASFKVTSTYSGVSVFSAMDASTGTVLTDREEVVFHAPLASSVGGNFFSTDTLQANIIQEAEAQDILPGPVDHFEIEDVPSSVKVNTDLTLTIVAKDKDNNVAKNYTGTILISTPDDENAILPNNGEYTFKEADQGSFTFNLALRFTQVGKQFMQVLDKDNWKIAGEREIEVVPQQVITVPDVSKSLVIKSPVDGGEFGSNLVIISGQGDPNINLKVFDDDVKIGDTETDSDGFFTYQAGNLAAGSHTFYVMSDGGEVSKSVTVNVDTLPPVLNSIQISPDGVVGPGTSLNIVVSSEPNLSEAKVRVQGTEKELLESVGQSGQYTVTVAAPALDGSFPVDVILVDDLSNKAELRNQATVQVQSPEAVNPPEVSDLEGVAANAEVTLNWEAVDHDTAISHYKVFYGTDHENLEELVETADDSTTVTITDLVNDTQYFFAVMAVDVKGNESESGVTIAVTPVSAEAALEDESSEETMEEEVSEEDLFPAAPEATETTEDEKESLMPPASLYNNPVIGSASSNTVSLTWQAFPGISAAAYKVYFGLSKGHYDDYVVTPDATPNLAIQDLINNVPYYFAVVALDTLGNEISPLSAEFTIVPQGAGFQSLPADQVIPSRPVYQSPLGNTTFSKVPMQEESGAEVLWVVALSLVIASGFYLKKKRLLAR